MKKTILSCLLAATSLYPGVSQTIDTRAKGEMFEPFWSKCVGAGRANEGLRAGWLEHLQEVKDNCGFEYVRFHGLFHDDMCFYFPKPDGSVVYSWQYIDDVFDRMLDMGVKPFVELGFFPKEIAREGGHKQFWWKGNVAVDRNNFDKWHDLVKNFTQHVVDRYGIDEVLTWYFEVWNEPNLYLIFMDGTKSDYFRLYKEAVLAVKSVDKGNENIHAGKAQYYKMYYGKYIIGMNCSPDRTFELDIPLKKGKKGINLTNQKEETGNTSILISPMSTVVLYIL